MAYLIRYQCQQCKASAKTFDSIFLFNIESIRAGQGRDADRAVKRCVEWRESAPQFGANAASCGQIATQGFFDTSDKCRMDQRKKPIFDLDEAIGLPTASGRNGGGLRIVRGASQRPDGLTVLPKLPRSAFAQMLTRYCDDLDREIERVRKS